MSAFKIVGDFTMMANDGRCHAKWRVRKCLGVPTEWVARYVEDDYIAYKINTCLTRYCARCFKLMQGMSGDFSKKHLTDEEAQELLKEAEVYTAHES